MEAPNPFHGLYEEAEVPKKKTHSLFEQAQFAANAASGRESARRALAARQERIDKQKEEANNRKREAKTEAKVAKQSQRVFKKITKLILKRARKGYKNLKYTNIRFWFEPTTMHRVRDLLRAEGFTANYWDRRTHSSEYSVLEVYWVKAKKENDDA